MTKVVGRLRNLYDNYAHREKYASTVQNLILKASKVFYELEGLKTINKPYNLLVRVIDDQTDRGSVSNKTIEFETSNPDDQLIQDIRTAVASYYTRLVNQLPEV